MYSESPRQTAARENNFTYHAPCPGQPARYVAIRQKANDLAAFLNANCPESRELSCAMTKLEEAMFWANASIARNEIGPAQITPTEGETNGQ